MCKSDSLFESSVGFYETDDLRKTAAFWEEQVGLPLVLDQGTCRIYRVSSSGFIGFCEKETVPKHEGVIITLVTSDVDEVVERLRAQGIKLEKEPTFNPTYNIYHAFFRDPNGYLVEVQRFEDPAWPAM